MKIDHAISPNSEDIEYLSRKINEETLDKGTCNPFAFFIRDDIKQIIAGCSDIWVNLYRLALGA